MAVNYPGLESLRLLYNPVTEKDLPYLKKLTMNPEVTYFTDEGNENPQNFAETLLLESVSSFKKQGYGCWGIYTKPDDPLIGRVNLTYFEEDREPYLGLRFFPEFWNRGFATEAGDLITRTTFKEFQIKNIGAWVHPQNLASLRVFEKLNFSLTVAPLNAQNYLDLDKSVFLEFHNHSHQYRKVYAESQWPSQKSSKQTLVRNGQSLPRNLTFSLFRVRCA